MKKLLEKLLNLLNVHPDKNQRWILLSLFLSGLLITYVHPAIVKEVYTNLPAEWIAFESLSSSVAGLVVGMLWKRFNKKRGYKELFGFCNKRVGSWLPSWSFPCLYTL